MHKPSLKLEKQTIATEEYSPAYVCDWGPLNEHWSRGTHRYINILI